MLILPLLLAPVRQSYAQTAENVAVVINEASTASSRIGEHYVQVRKIPATNVIRIRTTEADQIERAEYVKTIEGPIADALKREALQDRVLYLVLTKGMPLRVNGTEGRNGTVASVDSELTLLYRRLTGRQVVVTGSVPNPYYSGGHPIQKAEPFTHRAHDIYLVARLDAFTVEDAIAVIDRAQAPSTTGRIVLDLRSGLDDAIGDKWLVEAAARLREHDVGARVTLEQTTQPARNLDDVLGYYSWGSNDPQNLVRRVDLRFVPGALAATFASTDARTFRAPPDAWLPAGNKSGRQTWFAGSPQSLAGDLLREGVTGLAGNVAEPYLDGAVRPDILFPAYLSGFNLVEAFYLALPSLSWQTVVVGDPLCAPFRKHVLTRAEIEEPLDADTELPGIFSRRRMEVATAITKELPARAVALILKADARRNRGDKDGARRAFEEATEVTPRAAVAHMQLALMHEEAGEFDLAIARYRQVIETKADNVLALNNLAYALAVRRNALQEALPLARKAVALAPGNPGVVDTLAWIEHLLGNHKEAARLIAPLVQKSSGNAEIHLHAAIIYAAAGEVGIAATELKVALRLDPTLATRDEVKALRRQLQSRLP